MADWKLISNIIYFENFRQLLIYINILRIYLNRDTTDKKYKYHLEEIDREFRAYISSM